MFFIGVTRFELEKCKNENTHKSVIFQQNQGFAGIFHLFLTSVIFGVKLIFLQFFVMKFVMRITMKKAHSSAFQKPLFSLFLLYPS